ncbi:MAG: sialidase family protein, partial [Planctomycetota bacterium]
KTNLFEEETGGFRLYRIPGIVVTAKGTVLAYCEARKFSVADRGEIEIHLRRSTDDGRTWDAPRQIAHIGPRLPRNPHTPGGKSRRDFGGPDEQTVNNPMAIADRDGTVHFVYCVEYMRCFYMRSNDDGRTWSEPTEITATFDRFRPDLDWQAIATGPGHGIQLHSGRLLVPVWLANYDKGVPLARASSAIYSDDGGETWQRGELAILHSNEATAAELADGRVMFSARNDDPRRRRAVAHSRDGATAWSPTEYDEELLEPGCMASLLSCCAKPEDDRPLLLYSNPRTTSREHRDRRNLTIHLSYDDGQTWPVRRALEPGPSAYSDLAVLPDGTLLCFYESGRGEEPHKSGRPWAYSFLTLARFNLAWLTDSGTERGTNSP